MSAPALAAALVLASVRAPVVKANPDGVTIVDSTHPATLSAS